MNGRKYFQESDNNRTVIWQVLRNTFGQPFRLLLAGLLAFLFVSALAVVIVKNDYRNAEIEKHHLHQQYDHLRTQWMQLLLEIGTWGSSSRIENIATHEMNMVLPDGRETHIIVLHGKNPDQHEQDYQDHLL